MWPFALKEAAYWLNQLSLQSDGPSCEVTFFNVNKDFIDPLIYHTFGLPCFVLDSCLQLGVGGAAKWKPRYPLGIYVGHSPSHSGLVALVLNPPLLPPVSSSCNGEKTLLQSDNSLSIPRLINLETSGLWQSPRLAALNRDTQDGLAIAAYTSSTMQLKS
jgi:hypothetical protein